MVRRALVLYVFIFAFVLPLWFAHQLNADTFETFKACGMGVVIFPLMIPWPYVWANYVKPRGDRWRLSGSGSI